MSDRPKSSMREVNESVQPQGVGSKTTRLSIPLAQHPRGPLGQISGHKGIAEHRPSKELHLLQKAPWLLSFNIPV